jgi:hypothetical protein
MEAADQEWILQKVVLMMGIFGGCRCDELCEVMNCYSYYRYVIIFNLQILFHKIEFQLCVSESPCAKENERKRNLHPLVTINTDPFSTEVSNKIYSHCRL